MSIHWQGHGSLIWQFANTFISYHPFGKYYNTLPLVGITSLKPLHSNITCILLLSHSDRVHTSVYKTSGHKLVAVTYGLSSLSRGTTLRDINCPTCKENLYCMAARSTCWAILDIPFKGRHLLRVSLRGQADGFGLGSFLQHYTGCITFIKPV